MNPRGALLLGHIIAAAQDIQAFTVEGRRAFFADRKTQSAVIIRQLEITGEAVKNLSPELTRSEPAVPWRQIAGARDRLIHAYFRVAIDSVWSMVENDLPELQARVQRLLDARPA